jgi:esterase/lipase superfamily enzyme
VRRAVAASRDRDLIVYVHGANSTVERAAGQAAQLMHFTGRHSVVVLFAWPTAENFLRYPRDIETAFGAAPQLARLVALLAADSGAREIDLLSYSAGGTVASDGLALVGRVAGKGARLGEVIHAAPDADFVDFVDDLRDYAPVTRRVSVYANMADSALRLSEVINRGSRAGRPDWAELSGGDARFLMEATERHGLELVRIRPENIPGVATRSHIFWYDDPWVSSDVILTFLFSPAPDARGLVPGTASTGKGYWEFPTDYPARLTNRLAALSAGTPPPQ